MDKGLGWFGELCRRWSVPAGLRGPGGDLLFRALRRSTIGAEGFHGRVRDGIGCFAPRYGHQVFRKQISEVRNQNRCGSVRVS